MSRRKAVFLDRDGVLVENVSTGDKHRAAMSLEEFKILPEAQAGCDKLREAGFLLIVVTNQPEVSRGNLALEDVEKMNTLLADKLPLDRVIACVHDNSDNCHCRKPKPGMLTDAAESLDIDFSNSYMVGDRWKDIEAGKLAGCKTVWIDLGHNEHKHASVTASVTSLVDAVRWIEKDSSSGAVKKSKSG